MKKIAVQILSDMELVENLNKLIAKISISTNNKRNMLLGAFTRNVLSHYGAIIILIDKKIYNSAFALIRILFENILRLRYMYYIMNDTQIETIYNANNWDKYFPKILKMPEDIDKNFKIPYYSTIKQKAYKMMCDYTHTGSNQIRRNFSEDKPTIEPNFSDELILETLQSNRELLKTAIVVFLHNVGYKNNFLSKKEMDDFLKY